MSNKQATTQDGAVIGFDQAVKDLYNKLNDLSNKLDAFILPADPAKDELLSIEKVCKKLNISRRTFFEYKRRGLIACIQINAKILIRQKDLDKFLDEHYVK